MEPLAKISFSDVLKKAIFLFRFSFKSTFIYAFVVSLINQLLILGSASTYSMDGSKLEIYSVYGFSLYLFLIFVNLLIGNCFILIKQNGILIKDAMGFKATLQVVLSRFPGILLSGMAFILLSFTGIALYLVPGILFITCFYVYLPSLLFAHKRAFESWRYSFSLVRKHFLSTLALAILSLIIIWSSRLFMGSLNKVFFNDSSAFFGLDVTGMILLNALLSLFLNAMNLIWFYLLHKNKQ